MKKYNEVISEDRLFNPDHEHKEIAKYLYSKVKNLPIIAPHGHVDPKLFSENRPFSDPAELFIIPDHYIFRMLYSQGVNLESLGIPTQDGTAVEKDPRKIWQVFADNFFLFLGTPSGIWITHELHDVFEINERLCGENAQEIYNTIELKLKQKDFLPRNLYEQFNIEVLSTTDSATDGLTDHSKIKDSGWKGKVIPTFRPDAVTNLVNPEWTSEILKLGELCGYEVSTYKNFVKALQDRREFFKSLGAVATDHGALTPYTNELGIEEAEELFSKALAGNVTYREADLFTAHMLMEMARMSTDDGLVMQLHPGSFRDHNTLLRERFGKDKGADIPITTEYTNNLHSLLNKYGNNPDFSFIVFTLDETVYSRELAPLAGHYPAMKMGPAWWFHDSIQGMTRYREMMTETAGFYNTVGFNDDTRAFLSIPARHDVARRVDCNFLAGLVGKHQIMLDEAEKLVYELTNGLVKKAYKL